MNDFSAYPNSCPKCNKEYYFVLRCSTCKTAFCNNCLKIPANAMFTGNLQMLPCPTPECMGILFRSDFEGRDYK